MGSNNDDHVTNSRGEYATAKLAESLADLLGGAALIIAVCPGQAGLELHLSARFGEGLPIEAQRLLWDFVERTAASARQHATDILAPAAQIVVRDVKWSPDGEVSDTPAPKAKA